MFTDRPCLSINLISIIFRVAETRGPHSVGRTTTTREIYQRERLIAGIKFWHFSFLADTAVLRARAIARPSTFAKSIKLMSGYCPVGFYCPSLVSEVAIAIP
jgi:hypothetical protein